MNTLIAVAVMIAVVSLWRDILGFGLRHVGPKAFANSYEREQVAEAQALRSLTRKQVFLIEGVLKAGLGFALGLTIFWLVLSAYEPGYRFHLSFIAVNLVGGIGVGISSGYSAWNRVWNPKFDLPEGSHS
jgi:hypothetical protein